MHIRTSCGVFFECKIPGVEISRYIRLIPLDKSGRMKGPDERPLAWGHFDPSALRGLLPFDAELTGLKLTPPDEASATVDAQMRKEAALIDAMLAACGIKPEDCRAYQCMLNARQRVAWIFKHDSHLKMLTSILPPTASMTDAVFTPEELYKPFKA